MPLSVMKKLGIQEAQPTSIALQMVEKYLKQAHGIVENVLVKVGEFFLPADFVILDIGEDANDSLILGRPFLATERALIDVEKGELVLRMREDYLVFKVFGPLHHSDEGGTCTKGELTTSSLQGPLTDAKQSLLFKPLLVGTNKISPDIKPKFGVGSASSTKEGVPKKKVPRGWRIKKISSEDFSPGIKVIFIKSPILPHTVNRILSLEHIELIHNRIGKKFTVRDEAKPL
ncbi:hypothetical protein AHAS_Ahas16G0224900 [Arachis hypogaea]